MNQAAIEAKKELVNVIKEKLNSSSSSVIVEYRGLSVDKITELRKLLREEQVELKVLKNTMVELAVEDTDYSGLKEYLNGPNAVAFGNDAVAPSRVLAKFAKKNEKLVIKGGLVEGKILNKEQLIELSKLPNKEGMLSMLLSVLQAPVSGFARAVKAVSDSKESQTN